MQRKPFALTIVVGMSLAVLATDVLAQGGGRGRGGRGGGRGLAEENSQNSGPGRGRRGGGPAAGRFGGTQSVNPLFAALDANGDGVITTAEMEDAIQAFAKLDENKDGKLTVEEAGAAGRGHGHSHGGAAGGSSPDAAAGRGGRRRRGGAGAPAAGRGGRGGRAAGDTQPGKPATDKGKSKSPFDQ